MKSEPVFRRFDLDKTTEFVRDSMLKSSIWNGQCSKQTAQYSPFLRIWVEIIYQHEAESVSYQNSSMSLLIFFSNGNDVLLKFVHIENHHVIEYPGPKIILISVKSVGDAKNMIGDVSGWVRRTFYFFIIFWFFILGTQKIWRKKKNRERDGEPP